MRVKLANMRESRAAILNIMFEKDAADELMRIYDVEMEISFGHLYTQHQLPAVTYKDEPGTRAWLKRQGRP